MIHWVKSLYSVLCRDKRKKIDYLNIVTNLYKRKRGFSNLFNTKSEILIIRSVFKICNCCRKIHISVIPCKKYCLEKLLTYNVKKTIIVVFSNFYVAFVITSVRKLLAVLVTYWVIIHLCKPFSFFFFFFPSLFKTTVWYQFLDFINISFKH